MSSKIPPRASGIEIAVICALPLEARAARAIFEYSTENIEHDGPQKNPADRNVYTTGKIAHHNVVLVHMPGMGEIPAAAVAAGLIHSFERIRLALLVGICGGVPKEEPRKIMLGDVIVGKQVVQYDFGRQYPDGFKRKTDVENSLSRQNPEIRAFVAKLESQKDDIQRNTLTCLQDLHKKLDIGQTVGSTVLKDHLMPATLWHKHHNLDDCGTGGCVRPDGVCEEARNSSCDKLKCDARRLCNRRGSKEKPDIHFGSVASGNMVMKSGEDRDRISEQENIIAFDMEGAGVWDYLPCIVVKGVCDYADSHKSKQWQEYAAITAAACTRAILEQWPKTKSPEREENPAQNRFHNINSKIGIQSGRLVMRGTSFKM
ncbi:hypothetical protein FQN51_002588 [Onygenales sp. PD_10]|nr:hypothetical protein FQN51_002588 [Onygenales sp. PD_10]